MVAVGKILRFDEGKGYGFIAPAEGGDDVFVHANDFGELKHLVRPGMQVEYEVEEGDRGLKVATVRLLDGPSSPRAERSASGAREHVASVDDDGMCDILSTRAFTTEVTELLIQHVPSLTGAQITQIRQRLVDLAHSHSWLES